MPIYILKYTVNTGDLVCVWGFWVVFVPFVRCATCVLSFVWCARLSQFTPSLIYLFFALSCSSSLVARFAGGDLHYHGAGLRAGRRSGIVDVERFANGLLVYCDCNLDIVAAWHKLANQNPAFCCRRPSCWSTRDQPRRATRPFRHQT